MNRKQIEVFLAEQHGATIQPGYNYAIFSIRTSNPDQVANRIRANKTAIESAFGAPLLPFACYTRKKSVVVPIPFDASLNSLSMALTPFLQDTDAQIPNWN